MINMKRFFHCLLLLTFALHAVAQKDVQEPSVVERLLNLEKKTDLLNIKLNMHGSYSSPFGYEERGMGESAFKMEQLRLDIQGRINSKLYYRWRQRLNRPNQGAGSIDNMPASIDFAAIGINLSDRWHLFMGKQGVLYGGIEYDLNPIDIIEYSDMSDCITAFMTGVNIGYKLNQNHEINFQIVDSRNCSLEEKYGANLKKSKLPFIYTLNWNGSLWGGALKTRWSTSYASQAKDNYMAYIALGNQIRFSEKVDMYVDFMHSYEKLDDKGIMTQIVGQSNGHATSGVVYSSAVAKINYRFMPRWNIFAKGMIETAGFAKTTQEHQNGTYRTSYGYIGGIEYYPIEKSDLRFYGAFVGRTFNYKDCARVYGCSNNNTQRIQLGLIYQLPIF
jgi:hypothetical protein